MLYCSLVECKVHILVLPDLYLKVLYLSLHLALSIATSMPDRLTSRYVSEVMINTAYIASKTSRPLVVTFDWLALICLLCVAMKFSSIVVHLIYSLLCVTLLVVPLNVLIVYPYLLTFLHYTMVIIIATLSCDND
jgi:hypothetical protein